jgi:hypothetical protein
VATTQEITAKKNLILLEIGEQDAVSGPVAPNIDALWDAESGKGGASLELSYLFVKRKALDLTIGSVWRGSYIPVGLTQSKDLSGMVKFLQSERDAVQEQIDNYPSIGRINLDIYEPDGDEFSV